MVKVRHTEVRKNGKIEKDTKKQKKTEGNRGENEDMTKIIKKQESNEE